MRVEPNLEARGPSWLAIFAVLTAVVAVSFAITFGGPGARAQHLLWYRELGFCLLDWYSLAPSVPVIFWLVRRFPFERSARRRWITVQAGAVISFDLVYAAVALVYFSLRNPALTWVQTSIPLPTRYGLAVGRTYTYYFLVYLGISGLAHALHYYHSSRAREREAAALNLRASRLEAELARARLDALEMQLQPHFLFNTLNSIATLVREGSRKPAVHMIALLSDILRQTLDRSSTHQVPLRQELSLIEKYLELEHVRFADRLSVKFSIAPDALPAQVPYFILQPLVENALRHGVSRIAAASVLEIKAWREDGWLRLQVRDEGPGIASRQNDGVGLRNTALRLEQIFGSEHRFSLENGEQRGAVATVAIPFREGEPEAGELVCTGSDPESAS